MKKFSNKLHSRPNVFTLQFPPGCTCHKVAAYINLLLVFGPGGATGPVDIGVGGPKIGSIKNRKPLRQFRHYQDIQTDLLGMASVDFNEVDHYEEQHYFV